MPTPINPDRRAAPDRTRRAGARRRGSAACARCAILLLGWLAWLAPAAHAQLEPGDAVFGGNPLTVIARDGTFSTLLVLPAHHAVTAMTQAPDNDGLLIACTAFPWKPFLAVVNETGVRTTLIHSWSLPTPWEVMVDSDASIVVVGATFHGQAGFGHVKPDGTFKLVYEAHLIDPAHAFPLRATLDSHTGSVLCVNPLGQVLAIEREDPIHITTLASSSAFTWPGGIKAHPDGGKLLVEGIGGDFYSVDRAGGAKTRIYTAGSSVEEVAAWDVDPYLNALVVYRTEKGGIRSLLRIDLGTGVSTVVRSAPAGPEIRPMALWQTRILGHASGVPAPGETVTLRVSSPDTPQAPYLVAMSFAPTPGFTWRGRHIPLLYHPIIPFSLITPSIFAGFSGALDASGEAFPRVHVPAGLGRVRVYFAAMIMQGSAVHAVSRPFGLTIRPPE